MNRITYLPWDLNSWIRAFRMAGIPGQAILCLLIAEMVQLSDTGTHSAHESAITLVLVRGPFTLLAFLLWLSKPVMPKLRLRDFQLWFLIWVVWFCLSVAWSTYPTITIGKGVELVVATGVMMQASRDKYALQRLEGVYRLILLFTSLLGLITILGYFAHISMFVMPKHSILASTTAESPFLSGNGLGYLTVSLILAAFAEWQFCKLPRRLAFTQLAYAGGLFLFSSSRTSLAIMGVGFLVIISRRSKLLLISYGVVISTTLFFFMGKILNYLKFDQQQGNIDTLSGRTVIWGAAFEQWRKRPLMGFGGGAGGKYVLANMGNSGFATLSSLHSGVMECLTGLGIIGLVLGVGILTLSTFQMYKLSKEYPQYAYLYIWAITFWITSIMSIGVLAWMEYGLAIYLVLLAHIDAMNRNKRAEKARLAWQSLQAKRSATA